MRRKDQRGVAALEFAICLPILCLILFGIVGFGVLFAQDLALGNAARDAARKASSADFLTCADVKDIAVALANDGTPGTDDAPVVAADVSVTAGGVDCTPGEPPCEGAAPDAGIVVTIDYASDALNMPIFPDAVDISGAGEFRCEYH